MWEILKLISSALEFDLMIATTITTVYVSMDRIAWLIYNFAGLEEKVASAFDEAKIEAKKDPEKFNEPKHSIGLIIWMGLLFCFIRLLTKSYIDWKVIYHTLLRCDIKLLKEHIMYVICIVIN